MSWDNNIRFGSLGAQIAAAAERAALLAAEHVLGEAVAVVPIEEGTLGRSGKATAETQADAAVGAVSFATPYAVKQHEDLSLRHDQGREAKYLERPLTTAAGDGTIAAIAATEVRKVLG